MPRSLKLVLLVVFLLASYGLYGWVFNPKEPSLEVEMIEGEAWQRFEGDESQLFIGNKINANREVFVKEKSRIGLALEETKIVLEPNTAVNVQSISEQHIHLSLDNGRILASARRGSPSIQLTNKEQDINITDGQVIIGASDKGGLQMKVESGNAEIQSRQERLVLSSMEAGFSINGSVQRKPVTNIDPIPKVTNEKDVKISGTAAPGTKIEAAGIIGYAKSDMTFSVVVPLKSGINTFTAILTGPLDERSEFPIQIEQLPQIPVLHHAEIKWQTEDF